MSHYHSQHTEYFYSVTKSYCPTCHAKGLQIYGWGGFSNRKFHTTKYFCLKCFPKQVKEILLFAKETDNCVIKIKGLRGERLPNFLLELGKLLEGNPQQFLPTGEANANKPNLVLSLSRKRKSNKSLFTSQSQPSLFKV